MACPVARFLEEVGGIGAALVVFTLFGTNADAFLMIMSGPGCESTAPIHRISLSLAGAACSERKVYIRALPGSSPILV